MSFFCAAGPPALVYTGLPLPQLYIVLGSKSRVTATDEIFRLNIIMKKNPTFSLNRMDKEKIR